MIKEINKTKYDPLFQSEEKFFSILKPVFVHYLSELLSDKTNNQYFPSDSRMMAQNVFKALFDPQADSFKESFSCLKKIASNNEDIGFVFSNLMYKAIKVYSNYAVENGKKNTKDFITLCATLQQNLADTIHSEIIIDDNETIEGGRESGALYFHNMQRLKRDVKLFVHSAIGTSSQTCEILLVGRFSVVLQANDQQIEMIRQDHSTFILKNEEDEKNYSAISTLLNPEEKLIILEKFEKLSTAPLLSRKYPRAAIVHASLVHIANEHEYISGNMIDISEGGIGIMSASKSKFEKGQNIVAFISYESDDVKNFKFSFEANGIITSIIGKENAFRYGICLELKDEEKELVRTLVEFLNNPAT